MKSLSKIKLATQLWLRTRSLDLAWELAELKLFAGSPEALLADKPAVAMALDSVEKGNKHDINLKRRFLLSLLKQEEYCEAKGLILRFSACNSPLYRTSRLTANFVGSVKDFIKSIPLMPFALLILLLMYPVCRCLQRKLNITKDHSYKVYTDWLNVLFGILQDGSEYHHYWLFNHRVNTTVAESFITLRALLTAVPYQYRGRFIKNFRKQLSSHLSYQRAMREELA